MKPFKRTTEKILAWIANVLLLIITGGLSYVSFISSTKDILKNPEFLKAFEASLAQQNASISADKALELGVVTFKIYTVIYIVLLILVLIATFIIKKRIVAGIFFLLVAIGVGVTSVGFFFPIYILHFIVAIMLFVRKEPEDDINQNETVSYL
ncbi:DUF4064 domain-containing protein [Gemella bergeri]